MCPGLYNGSYSNWSVETNPCSIHLRFQVPGEKNIVMLRGTVSNHITVVEQVIKGKCYIQHQDLPNRLSNYYPVSFYFNLASARL